MRSRGHAKDAWRVGPEASVEARAAPRVKTHQCLSLDRDDVIGMPDGRDERLAPRLCDIVPTVDQPNQPVGSNGSMHRYGS
jgi:hypothetical protein